MKLIVVLGNPGAQYEKTRHNVGFVVLDRLARRFAGGAIARSKFSGALLEADIHGERTLLLKPLTFMNRSGQAVAEAAGFYKLDPAADLLIVVDDIALPCGAIRLRPDGGAGGHNGLLDVEQKLGTDRYPRIRIGVDSPGQIPQADYVTGLFRPEQVPLVEEAMETAAAAAVCWATRGIDEAMNQFNRRKTADSST
jgi:PTH1 family peptidyl-tRNA hydrolase